jgi:hypothetical protein
MHYFVIIYRKQFKKTVVLRSENFWFSEQEGDPIMDFLSFLSLSLSLSLSGSTAIWT